MRKQKEVCYLHYDAQCPGYQHMNQQATIMARLLGKTLRCIDVDQNPEYAEELGMFFPALVAVDDFRLVYPGSADRRIKASSWAVLWRGRYGGSRNRLVHQPGSSPSTRRETRPWPRGYACRTRLLRKFRINQAGWKVSRAI